MHLERSRQNSPVIVNSYKSQLRRSASSDPRDADMDLLTSRELAWQLTIRDSECTISPAPRLLL